MGNFQVGDALGILFEFEKPPVEHPEGFILLPREGGCRNPTLAKCGGEAQHLEKLEIWSPPGLPNVQSSTARPKTPFIEVFLVSLERS